MDWSGEGGERKRGSGGSEGVRMSRERKYVRVEAWLKE